MIRIKTQADLETLSVRTETDASLHSLLPYLRSFFQQLYDALSDGEEPEHFTLERHGYFVILEKSDNLRDLHEVGLHPQDRGLLGSRPEYVERLLPDSVSPGRDREWYQVAVLYNDDYMMFFYLKGEDFDGEVRQWLTDHLEETHTFPSSQLSDHTKAY